MRILLDNCTPRTVRHLLPGHEIKTAYQMGWADWDNGDLIARAETVFELLITTDQSIRYQQNLKNRRLAILLIPQAYDLLEAHQDELLAAVNATAPNSYRELNW